MNIPRVGSKAFEVLECFVDQPVMEVEHAIKVMKHLCWRDARSDATRLLRDAVAKNYLVLAFGKYRLHEAIKAAVIQQVQAKREAKKATLVQPAYRNIWSPTMEGYTASLYRNKRGYEGRYK